MIYRRQKNELFQTIIKKICHETAGQQLSSPPYCSSLGSPSSPGLFRSVNQSFRHGTRPPSNESEPAALGNRTPTPDSPSCPEI